jgi:hypothetical protein
MLKMDVRTKGLCKINLLLGLRKSQKKILNFLEVKEAERHKGKYGF